MTSTYDATLAFGHVPQVFCIPNWPRDYSSGTRAIWKTIEVVFSLKVNPWSSNFITEVNLKTYNLALVDDDEAKLAPMALFLPKWCPQPLWHSLHL